MAVCVALSACATGINVKKYNPGNATKEHFKQCRGFGCSYLHETKFTKAEWQKIEAVFKKKPAKTPAEERNKIAEAVGLMERIIGNTACTIDNKTGSTDCVICNMIGTID